MSESTNNTATLENEVGTLRQTNAELLKKKNTLKSRIAELENDVARLTERATTAEQARHNALVTIPLAKLAAEISDVPPLFLTQLHASYNVEADDSGNLRLLTKDGKPVKGKNDAPVELTKNGLWTFLTGGPGASYAKTEETRTWAHILRYQGPNGAGASGSSRGMNPPASVTDKKPAFVSNPSVGLR